MSRSWQRQGESPQLKARNLGWLPDWTLPLPPPAGGPGDFSPRSPPCLESQGFQFDPTFLWSSLVLLPSPIAFLSSFFCYWPIHLPFISLNLVFSKDRLFRLTLVLLFLSG